MRLFGHRKRDAVAVVHGRERPADRCLGRHMQHDGAVGRAAHARIGNAHHVLHACSRELRSGSADTRPPASRRRAGRRSSAPGCRRRSRPAQDRRCVRRGPRGSRTRRRGPSVSNNAGVAAARLKIAPSGASVPRNTTRPPSFDTGSAADESLCGRPSRAARRGARATCVPSTVMQSRFRRSRSSRNTAPTPPAALKSSM